ncbi:MAG: translocation/assembly module TamB domain-containing protein, partial [Gemmatimonadetes bacterium]|nr:translocation/assembly module TamB domain-containing protein [Gemmatimonadota bacterium]
PLNLADLERLGLVDEVPFTGPVRGTLASAPGDAFRLDLVGTVTPREGGPASTIAADGLLALADGTGADRIQLRGLRVSGQPLNLATLASLFPEQRERLQGTVTGGATLFGSPRNLRIEDGDLTYVVGDAPPTRLTNATGRVAMDPELRFDLRARAEPLALGTLAELFPALPVRDARVTGPIALSGTAQAVRFDVKLAGDIGGFAARGRVALGDVPRFDVEGTLRGFRPDRLLAGGVPMDGPLSGRFAVDGTTQDLRFDVDLTEPTAGRFALEGRVRQGPGAPLFEVAGTVTNFRLGALIGRPGMFPSPMTGQIALTGGGQQAYRFNVDLRGAIGLLDLRGWYLPGTVPSYAVAGRVAGLDVRGLPGFAAAPETNLTATVEIQGRGLTPETFAGRANIVAAPSVVGGMPLDAGLVRLVADAGILRVDTLALALGGTRINAAGQWGLTRPAPEPLRFSGYSPDLRTLAVLLPPPGRFEPQIAGSAAFSGTVGGTLASPVIAANLRGRALRYEGFRADTLAIDLRARRQGTGWAGNVTALGDRVVLPGGRSFDAFRLESVFTPQSASLGLFAGRDPQTAVSVSAVLDLQGGGFRGVRGAEIETLVLRLGPDTWQLAGPTRVRWGGLNDIQVERLVLRRTGDAPGFIEVDGRLATTGPLDLRMRVGGVDLAEVRRLVPTLPEMRGTVALEAALSGTAAVPMLALDATVDSLRYGGAEAERVSFRARYADRRATVDGLVRVLGTDIARFGGTVPMELSLGGTVPGLRLLDTQPLNARIEADSLPLGLLAAAIPGVRDGEGIAAARITVSGTPARPLVSGGVGLTRGALTIEALGARYRDIEARLALDGRSVRIDSLFARSDGTARVTGSVLLEELTRPRFDLQATFDGFQAIDRADMASLELSGRVALRGLLPEPVLTGRITLSDGTIAIPELSRRRPIDIAGADIGDLGADTIPIAVPTGAAVLAGLRVQSLEVAIGDNLWLRSPDANIQMGGEVIVSRVGPENRIT